MEEDTADLDPDAEEEETHDSFWQPDAVVAEEDDSALVAAPAADDAAEEPLDVAVDESAGGEEELVLDETHVPQVGDLTSAFFSELSAAQESSSRARKRRRGEASDADSDEEFGLTQRRAFHIPAHLIARYDPNAEPQSAEEYLLSVRMEAAACPSVKRSDIDPRAFEHRQTPYMPRLTKAARPANAACLPDAEWAQHFACQFAEARQGLLCFAAQHSHLRRQRLGLPARHDYDAWITYCLGKKMASASNSADSSADASAATATLPHCPSLALLVGLEQVECKGVLTQLLHHGASEIARHRKRVEHASTVQPASPSIVDVAPSAAFPSHAYALWLYALLLKVDKPLSDALAGDMRHMYRSISWMRAHDNRPESDIVKYCNLILTLCDQFGQRVEMQ